MMRASNDKNTSWFTILNGAAGGGRCGAQADPLLRRLNAHGLAIEPHPTNAPGHATELAKKAWFEGTRRFLCIGGDGTAFEILNGLVPTCLAEGQERITLGIIPAGTGNSFLRDMNIRNEESAIQALLAGTTQPCDIVEVRHTQGTLYYLNLLSIGFTAQVTGQANLCFKSLGTAGYIASVFLNLIQLSAPSDPIQIDDGPWDGRPAPFLSFCNSRYTGGAMMMAPHAEVDDGAIDIIRCLPLKRVELLAQFPKLFRGTHVHSKVIEERRAAQVRFEQDRIQPVMIDGEVLDLNLRSLRVVPQAIQVVCGTPERAQTNAKQAQTNAKQAQTNPDASMEARVTTMERS
ncbi:MAG: YegS/Rv2252/BmrU family lipid kinase [Myxococcota bacterium]